MPVFRRTLVWLIILALWLPVITAPSARAQDANTIVIGMTDLPTTLDPGEAYDFNAWEVLSHLYTGLTRQVPGTFDYELALAAAVEISEDRLTYAFTLRDDATFSDGTPITAQTFVDSVNRVLAMRREATRAVEPYVSSVEADDDGRLVFHLTRPVPYFLALVALPPYFPQHPDLARMEQPQPFPDGLTGNGPYTLDSFEVRERIVLRANPAYTLGPQPATDTIVLQYFPRSEDLREALRSHEIDLAWRALYLGHLIELEGTTGLQVVEVPSTRVFYLYLNHDREPFDDPAAREGVTLLIERDSVAEEAFAGHVTPLTSMIPVQFPDSYAPIWPDETDATQAEAILHEAGYRTRGQSLLAFGIGYSLQTYGVSHLAGLNQIVRRSLNISDYVESGVFTNIETPTLISAMERGEAGVAMFFAWTPLVPHPDAYLRPLAHSSEPIPRNGRYAKSQIDQLLDDAAQLDDPAEQGALYREVSEWLLGDYDLIPMWQEHLQVVAWEDIDGIQIEPNFFLHYDQLVRK
jgi:peptide/nickel transport system substrate-binding protein